MTVKCPHCGKDITTTEIGGLTKRQADTLIWLQNWDWSRNISPSFAEVMNGLGLRSKSGVSRLLHDLANRGFIKFDNKGFGNARKRSISLMVPQ